MRAWAPRCGHATVLAEPEFGYKPLQARTIERAGTVRGEGRGIFMAHRLLAALLVLVPGVLPAAAQSKSSSLRTREAAAALVRGSVEQAITLYTEALEDKSLPNDRRATILNDRGVAYSRRQQTKEAIEDFNRAIQLYPEYAAIYNNRGNVLLALGAVREALKDFDRAIVLAPGYAAAFSNRAGAYMRLGQVDRRSSTTRGHPADADQRRPPERTRACPTCRQRPHGAIRDFTRAVSADARFGAGYRSRAEAKLVIDRYDEAIEDFSRAIAFEPRNAEVYALRGQAYLLAANAPSAVNDFSKAIELAPGTATYFACARSRLRQGGDLRGRAQRFLHGH